MSEDFRVEEILADGSRASSQPDDSKVSGWGRYLLCALVKRNWDNLIAVRKVAEYLSIDPDRIQIAGIKDAKALTAQHMTISGIAPERISTIGIKDIMVKPLRFVDEKMSSQRLFGNRFHIAIRAVKCDVAIVEERIEKIRSELENFGGLPNYFGHQRFGTTRPVTHLTGYYIVRRDFEEAALTFLSRTSDLEPPDSREARRRLGETRDFEAALNYFPARLLYERLMLRHLAKFTRDFLGAFHRLPLRLRRLFVQAYQSLLFNKFLSERIKRGIPVDEPQVGDYVIDMNKLGLPAERFCEATADNLPTIKKKMDEGKAGIAIPLVGFRQQPSGGVQGSIEKAVLEEESISPGEFQIPEMPRLSSPGALRLILASILDFHSENASKDPLNAGKLMVELGFTLRRGSYATVLLREFMKPRKVVEAGF